MQFTRNELDYVLEFIGESIMRQGIVKWYNCKKGYGFITPDGETKDVFVHATQLEKIGARRLFDEQRVSFEIYDDRGRNAAGNIKIL